MNIPPGLTKDHFWSKDEYLLYEWIDGVWEARSPKATWPRNYTKPISEEDQKLIQQVKEQVKSLETGKPKSKRHSGSKRSGGQIALF